MTAQKEPDLEAWEQAVLTAALAAGGKVLATILERVGTGRRTVPVRCSCGHPMVSIGQRSKTLTTLLGPVSYRRSLFRCPACQATTFPADRALDVEQTGFSPGVRRLMARAGSRTSFAEAEEDLYVYARLRVNRRDIERLAEETGRQIESWQFRQPTCGAEPPSRPIPILYISFDGTAVPMRREELRGRRGKGPDGSAQSREVKLGCVFTQTRLDEDGLPVRDEASSTYVAGLESSHLFGERLYHEARQRGLDHAQRVVVLTDGAAYNKSIVQTHFPNALHIIDLYHAREHLHQLAELLRPSSRSNTRLPRWIQWLDQGNIERLVAEVRLHLPPRGPRRREGLKQLAYFQKNAPHMRYAAFRRLGLFIGSGVVEAGCRTVVAQRLKQSGMFWSVRGAHAILQVRCCLLSGRFDQFWEDRAAV